MSVQVGDRVLWHLLRRHVCVADETTYDVEHCECHYPLGSSGPNGLPGRTVTRVATVVAIVDPEQQVVELDVELTDEDQVFTAETPYGYVRKQTYCLKAQQDPPESGCWTPLGASR